MANNGRKYFLEVLPGINDLHWDRITRDLFESKDRFHVWRLELDERFAKLEPDELNRNCHEWTARAIEWLQQIALDLRFAKDLFRPDEWDFDILGDFMNLLGLAMYLFHGQTTCLGRIKAHCEMLSARDDQSVLIATRDIPKEFNEWRTTVNNDVRLLVEALGYNKLKNWDKENRRLCLQDGDKVPAATFLELLIRNEIQRQRRRIVSRPVAQHSAEGHTGVEAPVDATEVIGVLTSMARPVFASC
jgi:hypothetical protein